MKKLLSLVLVCLLLATLLAGCGGSGNDAPAPAGNSPSANKSADPAPADNSGSEPTGEKKQVYVFVKNRGDLSMWDSIAAGGDRAAAELSSQADVFVVETTPDIQACLTAMYEAADKGADLIYAGNDFVDCLIEVGQEYPEIAMFSAGNKGNFISQIEKGYAFQVRNDACYLAGILAADVATSGVGDTSSSGVIGFIGGMDETINVQNQFLGYINGAKSFAPEVKIVQNYVGSWNDPDKAKDQSLAQYNDANAEVIFTTAGASGTGAYGAAVDAGKYAIGADVNMEVEYAERPDTAARIVTSTMVNYNVIVFNTIKKFLDEGALNYGAFEFLGMADGAVTCVEGEGFNTLISEKGKAAFNEAKAKIMNGEIEIPGALDQEQDVIKALIEESLNK